MGYNGAPSLFLLKLHVSSATKNIPTLCSLVSEDMNTYVDCGATSMAHEIEEGEYIFFEKDVAYMYSNTEKGRFLRRFLVAVFYCEFVDCSNVAEYPAEFLEELVAYLIENIQRTISWQGGLHTLSTE